MAVNKESQLFKKPAYRWRIIFVTFVALTTGLVSVYSFLQLRSNVDTTPPVKQRKIAPARVAITALGRIQPQGEITKLSPPSSLSGVRVEKLLVKEGEEVAEGEVVAFLEGYARSKAALQQAKDKVEIAQAKLEQIKAGAKKGDIDAQKATISQLQSQLKGEIAAQQATVTRLQAQLANAQTENDRYQRLYQQGAISSSTADTKRLQMSTQQQQLLEAQAALKRTVNTINDQINQAKAKLVSIAEVRPVDVQAAQTEVKSAITAVEQAKADYDLTYVVSPISGKVLKVRTKSGEVSGNDGIVDIGKTSQMMVFAEVYQTDISKVRLGQKAIISSTAFPKKLRGTVSKIGLQVDRQNVLSVNPEADTDRRVIQVKILIDDPEDSKQVEGLTNLQVDVAIQI
ncbi:ABC exporter membrane fusion protein [Aetokthonos hydrillicola Thurmond2011]|jgi:HlyD family secretion protein|uniref:ABC exporter membrane fusion protein n=1 Tax=Aetokthonos hydrillicola Thurmond2011 TaxID=2712845 RepID=A0AAP5IA14_9CYAN|nr:ABC exporter membrane fusion protein [Aetokthonos hydrillicola]MBO3463382.1 ABC exporter membrane fusion protein [Aetokthonos hydrillicola CCALA 1050]MBW4586291.1 ABC exporter membrane fusion protein [Aetokthonos hydrillicola CCALA 1050]MDR9897419.1 ABC exporter membrane fusion protein [Aetokthonos hydrillicola Thurmond2011]